MSGVETVVGLVLGVLPLLISTVEHYDDVFRPFRRYKRFSKELKKFQQEFLGHKTIFHNECLLLLSTFTGVETANDMLRDPEHPLRKDLDLNKKLSDQLGASREACHAIIGMIIEELSCISRECQNFELVMSEDDWKPKSSSYKVWRQKVGAKLKFCISENRLDQRLSSLKNYNRVFGRLSAQTKELKNSQKTENTPSSTPRFDQRLKECTLVRDAAIQLYSALVESCASHPEHLAHFRLDPHYEIGCSPQLIRFDMAFTQNLLEGRAHNADPVWFAIESMLNDTLRKPERESEEAKEAWSNFHKTLKRAISQDLSPVTAKKPKCHKTVSFASLPPPPKIQSRSNVATPTLPAQISTIKVTDSSLPNFCIGRDFCSHVRRCSKRALSNSDTYIGYLQRTGTCSHRVYYKPPKESLETNAVVTLSQIFSSISAVGPSQKHSKRMLQYESLRLARQLASAVLQFHATPILEESWRSEDVVFFGQNNMSILQPQHPDMKTPHLNVRVRTRPGKSGSTDSTKLPLNTNSYTFGLGIILLELAHQAPFHSLRLLESNSTLPSDDGFPQSSSESNFDVTSRTGKATVLLDDFCVASRLARDLSAEMGVPYARMVRKCLNCDFGLGTRDLRDEGLQEAFHRDVVCELERLERAFAGLQLSGGAVGELSGI